MYGRMLLGLVILSGCGVIGPQRKLVKVDELYLLKNASKRFEAPKQDCARAAVLTLGDLGASIEEFDKENGEVETNRFRFTDYVVGNRSYARRVEEHQKIRIRIIGSDQDCRISFIRYRTWVDGRENPEMYEEAIKSMTFEPFFKEVDIRLKSKRPAPPKPKLEPTSI